MAENAPNPPRHLSKESKSTWSRLVEEFDFTPDQLGILQVGLENWDRSQQARKLVAKEGLVLNGKRHPAIDILKQCDGLYLRAVRQLGLDTVEPGPVGRPPGSLH